ncbi:unnamed protein product, partial [Heterosigma akashiwo]
ATYYFPSSCSCFSCIHRGLYKDLQPAHSLVLWPLEECSSSELIKKSASLSVVATFFLFLNGGFPLPAQEGKASPSAASSHWRLLYPRLVVVVTSNVPSFVESSGNLSSSTCSSTAT